MSLRVRIAHVVVTVCLLGLLTGMLPALARAESCPNEQLRAEQGDQHLPDCRAYELVTPSEKAGTQDLDFSEAAITGGVAVASSGERVYLDANSFLGFNPSHDGMKAVFSRTASGWQQSASLQPSDSGQTVYVPEVWNPELTMFGTVTRTQSSSSKYILEQTFGVGPAGGPYRVLAVEPFTPGYNLAKLDATSPDFSNLIIESINHSLAPGGGEALQGAHNLYEWSSKNGQFQLVNITSGGSLINDCGAEAFHAESAGYQSLHKYLSNVVSDDGSKIFFNAPQHEEQYLIEGSEENASCQEPSQLYMRVDGRETVEISAPEAGVTDPTGSHRAEFMGASADGTKVWFITPSDLTADDSGQNHGAFVWKLYEYNTTTRKLTHISRAESGNVEDEVVTGEIAISEDGSTVYFLSKAKLTSAAPVPPGGGIENLYSYNSETDNLTYVATANFGRHELWTMFTDRTGNILVFESFGFVMGPNGVILHEMNNNINQIYRYDATDDSLKCITCSSGGKSEREGSFFPFYADEGIYEESFHGLSENGDSVFFDSDEALVTQDTNGNGSGNSNELEPWTDVYEWEAPGTGSCAGAEGCLSLISSGTNDQASSLMGASVDGNNVFFSTHSALVPQDGDLYGDLYDARVYGGFAAAPAQAVCAGESCRLIGSAPPAFGTPQSVAFSGAGNPVPVMSVEHKVKVKKKQKKKKSKHRKPRRGHGSARKVNRRSR